MADLLILKKIKQNLNSEREPRYFNERTHLRGEER